MARKTQMCTRCGKNERLAERGPFLTYSGLCGPCVSDSRRCPKCREMVALADMRGSYCKPCRSAYYREWNQRGRHVSDQAPGISP